MIAGRVGWRIQTIPGRYSPLLAVLVVVLLLLIPLSQPVAAAKRSANKYKVHTIFSTECDDYFDWQSLGLVYSHKRAKMPGPITRLMACSDEDLKRYKNVDLVPTYVHPPFNGYAPDDTYSAFNKPGSVLHWLTHAKVDAEWLIFIDADMVIRRPFTPDDVGASKGHPVAGFYGYLNGVKNRMAAMFLPPDALPFADQVGGWAVMHADDMRRVAPLWLNYTREVRRRGSEVWNLTGDVYVSAASPKAWISEMYGYVFANAALHIKHTTNDPVMLYPGYTPGNGVDPYVLHYGIGFDVQGYHFDKHIYRGDMMTCPGRLFPRPPDGATLTAKGAKGAELRGMGLSVECVETLNAALAERHERACGVSYEAPMTTGRATAVTDATEGPAVSLTGSFLRGGNAGENTGEAGGAGVPSTCVDTEDQCGAWAAAGECGRNARFMTRACGASCGACGGKKGGKSGDESGDETGGKSGGGSDGGMSGGEKEGEGGAADGTAGAGAATDAVPAMDSATDSKISDSGIPDSGISDSGIPDSGISDSGIPDSGISDAAAGGDAADSSDAATHTTPPSPPTPPPSPPSPPRRLWGFGRKKAPRGLGSPPSGDVSPSPGDDSPSDDDDSPPVVLIRNEITGEAPPDDQSRWNIDGAAIAAADAAERREDAKIARLMGEGEKSPSKPPARRRGGLFSRFRRPRPAEPGTETQTQSQTESGTGSGTRSGSGPVTDSVTDSAKDSVTDSVNDSSKDSIRGRPAYTERDTSVIDSADGDDSPSPGPSPRPLLAAMGGAALAMGGAVGEHPGLAAVSSGFLALALAWAACVGLKRRGRARGSSPAKAYGPGRRPIKLAKIGL